VQTKTITKIRANVLKKMEKLITHLKDKTDDPENCSRSNIRIIDVPEKAEGCDAVRFLKKFIPQILGNDNFTSPVTLERAHRIGKTSSKPRPLIAKFLNFRDEEKVLRLAKSKGEITYENKKILPKERRVPLREADAAREGGGIHADLPSPASHHTSGICKVFLHSSLSATIFEELLSNLKLTKVTTVHSPEL